MVMFRKLSTPFTTVASTGHAKGAFYGLEVAPRRVHSDALRPRTPVKGLCLAGTICTHARHLGRYEGTGFCAPPLSTPCLPAHAGIDGRGAASGSSRAVVTVNTNRFSASQTRVARVTSGPSDNGPMRFTSKPCGTFGQDFANRKAQ